MFLIRNHSIIEQIQIYLYFLTFIFILYFCTKKSHAVPVENNRTFYPSLIKNLHKVSLKIRDENVL